MRHDPITSLPLDRELFDWSLRWRFPRGREEADMAAPLRAFRRLLQFSGNPTLTLSRSAFRARRDDLKNPDWVKVSISLAATVAIWVLIFKQQNDAIAEYERRKAERECS